MRLWVVLATVEGVFLVVGAFHVISGNVLALQEWEIGVRQICDHDQGVCKTLI